MYMSRMELDMSNRETVRALAAPKRLHGAIEEAFPGERKRRLWRIDRLGGRCYVLIVSEDQPDLSSAARQFSPPGAGWETRDYQPLLRSIRPGISWRFRLAANPTVSRVRPSGARGKVFAHVTVKQQKNWLLSRGEKHGFQLKDTQFDVVRRSILTFPKGEEWHRVTLSVCEFEGVLTVTEETLFRMALTEGIGRGKAYGLGMLTVVRDRL